VLKDGITVVIYKPRSSFDVAVLARTLYTGLGPEHWSLVVVGRVPRSKAIVESRVPVRLALERITFLPDNVSLNKLEEPVITADPGRRDEPLAEKPRTIIACVGDCPEDAPARHGVLGSGDPVYETIALLYAYYIRGSRPPCKLPSRRPPGRMVPKALYLARKLLEAVEWFDNRLLLKPSVVAHSINKAVMEDGLLVDYAGWSLEGEASTRQVIRLEVYTWRLRRLGEARAVFDSSTRLFRVEGIKPLDGLEVCLDPEHGRACIGPSEAECISVAGPGVTMEELRGGLEALGL